MTKEQIDKFWRSLNDLEKISIMKIASGLHNPTAIIGWKNAPEQVVDWIEKHTRTQ